MEEQQIWISEATPTPLGRVMTLLLGSRPKLLEASISRLSSSPHTINSQGLLGDSLRYIQKYIRDAIDKGEPLDQVLIPMIEASLKTKGSSNCKQVLILLSWLFQDELVLQDLSHSLVQIIMRKFDRYIAFGWCTLIQNIVDHWLTDRLSSRDRCESCYRLLKVLCQAISHLTSIISEGSAVQDGFELPSRLSIVAADCICALTEALTGKAPLAEKETFQGAPNRRKKLFDSDERSQLISFVNENKERESNSASRSLEVCEGIETEWLLWTQLDELAILVQKLEAWNRKSRPLHAKGIGLVLKWLHGIKRQYGSLKREGETVKLGVMLLSSCWKHYVMLLRLENSRVALNYIQLLDQYTSAIQLYADENIDGHFEKMNSGIETLKFFLTCICLLMGRLDSKQFEKAINECGEKISNLLLSLFHCKDEVAIDAALGILRALVLRSSSFSTRSYLDFHLMESVYPLLLKFLDERDSIARAVVHLAAEFCFLYPDAECLKEIFVCLDSGQTCQRRNAIDVIVELIRISSEPGNSFPPSVRQDVAQHMLERLGDEEPIIRLQASRVFQLIDPPLVLPMLVRRAYSPDERVQISARDAILDVLSHHHDFNLIIMLLDSLSNLSQNPDFIKSSLLTVEPHHLSAASQEGVKFNANQVLQLVPKWAETVCDWGVMIEPLIDKLFADPSNAIIVRFLSYISEHLAKFACVVLHRVLFHSQGHNQMGENWLLKSEIETSRTADSSLGLDGSLFSRLCPLLIIRILPLEVFDDLNSSVIYGQLLTEGSWHEQNTDNKDDGVDGCGCIASLIINRAFQLFEFEDVRKLAAELCGRLHPQVLFPIIKCQLGKAVHDRDVLKLKTCLFAVCTSLMTRGSHSVLHPVMNDIRKTLEVVLLWPSLVGDEVSKAQHGCIDCLAWMICAELQALPSSEDSRKNKIFIVDNSMTSDSIIAYVIQRLTSDKSANNVQFESPYMSVVPRPFRLCMANVLISTCQKISSSARQVYARRMLPSLIHSIEVIGDFEIRAACLQILFSAVYHLKSSVVPYALDLLKLSVKCLRKGSDKEKVASAKLMAALMASEDEVVESLSSGLLEVKSVLTSVSSADSSPELLQLCRKLLLCVSPLDDILRQLSIN